MFRLKSVAVVNEEPSTEGSDSKPEIKVGVNNFGRKRKTRRGKRGGKKPEPLIDLTPEKKKSANRKRRLRSLRNGMRSSKAYIAKHGGHLVWTEGVADIRATMLRAEDFLNTRNGRIYARWREASDEERSTKFGSNAEKGRCNWCGEPIRRAWIRPDAWEEEWVREIPWRQLPWDWIYCSKECYDEEE
jgi:hypothetical protein